MDLRTAVDYGRRAVIDSLRDSNCFRGHTRFGGKPPRCHRIKYIKLAHTSVLCSRRSFVGHTRGLNLMVSP